MRSEYTVTIDLFHNNWNGQGERPIWHSLVLASSKVEAIAIGKLARDAMGAALPPSAKVAAEPRFM